ncbi:fungal-specific transcription factor domain-containing protein [Xylariaceae sp. FL0594]|nr:fungal-specific transcription factor domain-containing protein [Xylariaceae sp. FL0594]
MPSSKRSKNGCWTCRLRRKKCNEEGPPCSNCESRGVFCHGYGPRPAWKDRGDREREEAIRLFVESKARSITVERRTASITPSPPAASRVPEETTAAPLEPLPHPPPVAMPQPASMLPTPSETCDFDILELLGSEPSSTDTLCQDWWENSASGQAFHPDHDLNLAPTPASYDNFAFASSTAELLSHRPADSELELMMHFILETFPMQHAPYQTSSASQKGWLLLLLMRSPTFYYAALSLAAYQIHAVVSRDSKEAGDMLAEYRKHRTTALDRFSQLLRPDSSDPCIQGELLICALQMAQLEAWAGHKQDAQSYLDIAAQFLVGRETSVADRAPSAALSVDLSLQACRLESTSLHYFKSVLVRRHVLCSSVRKLVPLGAETYRTLLADDYDTARASQEPSSCRNWTLLAIMDATALNVWKAEQEALRCLSIRELVKRAEGIETRVEQKIAELAAVLQQNEASPRDTGLAPERRYDRVREAQLEAYLFAHAISLELHVIVSGPRVGIAEIRQSIDRAIEAWKLRPKSLGFRSLAWPYCATASLATGPQRDFFREIAAEMAELDPTIWHFHELVSAVEKCWTQTDRAHVLGRDTCYDWKDALQSGNMCGFLA